MGFFVAPPAAAVSGAALRGKHQRRRWRRSAHGSGTHHTPTHQPPRAQSSPSTASHPPTHTGRISKRYCVRCLTRAREDPPRINRPNDYGMLRLLWIVFDFDDWRLSWDSLKSFNSWVAFATNECYMVKKIYYFCTEKHQTPCQKPSVS